MNKTTKISLALVVAASLAGVVYPVFRPAQAAIKRETPLAERLQKTQAFDREEKAGLAALARGNDSEAEVRFRAALAAFPAGKGLLDIRRAEAYDRLGRDREAFAAYRDGLFGLGPRAYSSAQDDPIVLARYGDLAARFGRPEDVLPAYRRAVEHGMKRFGIDSPSSEDDPALTIRSDAAAHFAAALQRYFTAGSHEGRVAAQQEFARAVALAPRSAVALQGLARANRHLGQWELATRQMAQAEALASGSLRKAIHQDREYEGYLPLEQNQAAIRARIAAAHRTTRLRSAKGEKE